LYPSRNLTFAASSLADLAADDGTGLAPLSGYSASYSVVGDGPPLVVLPGLAGGTALLRPLVERLARAFRVFAVELRGEANPFDIRRRFTAEDLVGDVLEFLALHQLERPLLLGVSFGGAVALELASRHACRIGGLVVQGADLRFEPTLLRRVAGDILSGYPLPTDSPFVNQFFNLLFGRKPRDRALADFVIKNCWRTDQAVMARRFRIAEEIDLTDRLDSIRTPTLLVHGGRDLFVSSKGLAEMISGIPEAESVELPQAGHLAFVTHATEIALAVERFAQDVGLLETTTSALQCDYQA